MRDNSLSAACFIFSVGILICFLAKLGGLISIATSDSNILMTSLIFGVLAVATKE